MPGFDAPQPAGEYRVDQDEERSRAFSRLAWRRVGAFIHLPAIAMQVQRSRWCRSTRRISTPHSKRTTNNHDRHKHPRRNAAVRIRRDTATHLFTVGQTVRLKGGFGRPALPGDIYHITGTLPPRGDSPQYRIRNDDERHERVTTQDDLEPVGMSRSGERATLIERTFGHG